MNASNNLNLNSNVHANNSFPVSRGAELMDGKSSVNGPKVEAKKNDVQGTALLNSLPEKNQAAITDKNVEKGNSADNSNSFRATLPNYVKDAGGTRSASQHDFNKLLGFGSGPAMWVEAEMDNMFYPSKSPLEIFRNFLEEKKENNVNRPLSYEKGESYLGVAAKLNKAEIVQFLIEKNASVDYRDNDGKSALDIARDNRSLESMKVLAQNGATLTDADVRMLEEESLANRSPQTSVDMPEENKNDRLLTAVYDRDFDTMQQLLDEGVDPEKEGEKAISPMNMALRMNNEEVLSLLRARQS